MIRVLLCDDEPLVRTGLHFILDGESDIEVIGEAESADGAVVSAGVLHPDVVLMDIHMKGDSGIDAARRILDERPHVRVVMLTTFDYDDYVQEALRLGVSGFLLKEAPREDIVSAVRVAHAGKAMLDPAVTRRVIQEIASRTPSRAWPGVQLLSARELDVMRAVARGLSNAEISSSLVVSETTVKTHIRNILLKLQARDRTQIAIAAYDSGLAP